MKVFILLLVTTLAAAELATLFRAEQRISDRHIIVLEDEVDIDAFTSRFQVDASMIGQRPFIVRKLRTALNAIIADLTPEAVQLVRSLPGVKFVEEDSLGYIDETASWGTDRVNQVDIPLDGSDKLPYYGKGANIYIIDTGINIGHTDFEGRASYGADYVDGSNNDCQGHGTHCAGTAAGKKYGVAKEANVIAVRVCDCRGACTASALTSGVDFVAKEKSSGKQNVVASMSLSRNSVSFANAVREAIQAGVVAVTSSGNDRADACSLVPGNIPEVITVGNTQSTDRINIYSNYGTCVDILAPGTNIVSCSHTSNYLSSTKTGTSMACPHVAGAAGIVMANRGIAPENVQEQLVKDATDGKIDGLRDGTPNKLLFIK